MYPLILGQKVKVTKCKNISVEGDRGVGVSSRSEWPSSTGWRNKNWYCGLFTYYK